MTAPFQPEVQSAEARAPVRAPLFATTHWSVVLQAGGKDPAQAEPALEQLCRAYWYPVYSFTRRMGYSSQDAEDATQGFFAHFVQHRLAARVAPERGRFRSFILVALRNFLSNQRQRELCQKRGGGCEIVSIDAHSAQERYGLEPADVHDPVKQYELNWANTILERALRLVREEFKAAGREALFEALKGQLVAEPADQTYAAIGQAFAMSETAIKGTVFRMRRRYRELFRAEVAQTLGPGEDLESEIGYLLNLVGS